MPYGAGASRLKPALVLMATLTFVGAPFLRHAVRAYIHRLDSRIRNGARRGCPRPFRPLDLYRPAGVVMGHVTVGGSRGSNSLIPIFFTQLSGPWIDLQQGVARGLVIVGAFASLTLGPTTSPIPASCFLASFIWCIYCSPGRSSTGGRRARLPHIEDLGSNWCRGRRRHRPRPKRRAVAGFKIIIKRRG